MKTCGSFAEVKKPEHALKIFIRFVLAKAVVTYGLELMMAVFNIVQGVVSTIMNAAGFGGATQTVLPQEMVSAIEDVGFFDSIPLWAVTLIGGLFITVLSFVMIMSVYGNRTDSSFQLCRRANTECWKIIFKIIYCCMFRRCDRCISVYHLFFICNLTTSSRYKCSSYYASMELYR